MGEVKKMSKIFVAVVVIGGLGILLRGVDKTACASGTSTTSSGLDPVGRIVYSNSGTLKTINADGTEKEYLRNNGVYLAGWYPSWSPDGNKFAYVYNGVIYVATADGKTVNKLVDNGKYPDWSPDGSKIAFERNGEVWTIKPDGTGETRAITKVTDPCQDGGFYSVYSPDWSPDGSRFVVYGSGCDGLGLYIVDADGRGATIVAISTKTDAYGNSYPWFGFGNYAPTPKWSPDGTMIAFWARETGGDANGDLDRQRVWRNPAVDRRKFEFECSRSCLVARWH
jgi:Tol biopolymer transport system component